MEINDIQSAEIDPSKLQGARGNRSPSEVARALGIPYQHLWAIENGKRNPSASLLVKLCLFYGVDLSDIVTEKKMLSV